MSEDEVPEVPEHEDPVRTIGEVAGEVEPGLDAAAKQIPEEEADARAAVETAGDVVGAASNVVKAAQAAAKLGEALAAGDEGRAASAVGNLAGGVLGTAGSLVDAVAGVVPAEAREGLNTVASVARGAATVARSTERVVSTFQAIERAVTGRRVVFHTNADLGDDRLVAERAAGMRRLSGLYEFKLLVEHDEEGGLDDESIDGLLTRSARLGLNRDTAGSDDVNGVLRRLEMLPVSSARSAHYELTLVPKLWRLNLVKRSRVFQDMSHIEVVLDVLAGHGFDPATHVFDQTEATYPTHEYVVQYRETDIDFISRLLEHNGVHYRFEQNPRTEALILGDRNASFVPVQQADELRYHPHEYAADDGAPRIWDLRRIRQPRFAEVILRDYNWRTPLHPVQATEAVDEATGYGFLDLYGEHVPDGDEGARLALVRAEEQLVDAHTFEAKTAMRGVLPGTYFDLVNHPHADLNQRYLVIEADEAIDDGHTYLNTFKAIPFAVTYRPPRTVRWPKIDGILNAIVDGEARSTATPIDDDGRYRVVIPLDDGAAAGGSASRWVRRAQPSAGAGYGMHFPLHIGTEVAVAHVNGDPDRPVILGAVPNAATQSPVVAGNAPQSRIRTGSGVVFELDDDC